MGTIPVSANFNSRWGNLKVGQICVMPKNKNGINCKKRICTTSQLGSKYIKHWEGCACLTTINRP